MRTVRKAKPAPAFQYSPLVAALALAFAPQAYAVANPYEVTNTGDAVPGSLSYVINFANANCATNPSPTITFNIPTGPFVISSSPSFPEFFCATNAYTPTVNGYSQPGSTLNTQQDGFDANIQIVLDGAAYGGGCGLGWNDAAGYGGFLSVKGMEVRNFAYGAGLCGNVRAYGNRIVSNQWGLDLYDGAVGDGSKEGRNVIGGNSSIGVWVSYGGSVGISGNFIGTLDGVNATPNYNGIIIGGSDPSSITGNVISGNTYLGLQLNYDGGSSISGNKIGVNATGTAALPNTFGILISYAYGGTMISSNTISGNYSTGVQIYSSSAITLAANKIGTDAAGSSAIANSTGVNASCSSNIGLNSNVISGNFLNGVGFFGVDGSVDGGGLVIQNIVGNYIGTGAGGAGVLANGGSGIEIAFGDCTQQNNLNGISQNVIANNFTNGVALFSGVGNELSRNSIYDNGTSYGGRNININNNAPVPLPNDPGDADTGPNNQQNYPTIDSVTQSAGSTTVNFTMDSTPLSNFRVEIFSNPAAGAPAGRTWRANTSITTNPTGVAMGSYTLSGILADNISLTATDLSTHDTSEFSPLGTVNRVPAVVLSATQLDFGTVAVGSSSSPQSVSVSSVGSGPYQINQFDSSSSCYGGPICSGGGFTCSTTCATTPAQYDDGTSCSVTASFSPTFAGPQSTTVYLCDNTAATPHSITLTGSAVIPTTVVVEPSDWDFGGVLVGTQSGAKTFFIANHTASPTNIGALSTTGAFSLLSTNCTGTVPQGSSCTADVAFSPTLPGFTTGSLDVAVGGTAPAVTVPGKVRAKNTAAPAASAQLFGTGIQEGALDMPSAVNLGTYVLGAPPVSRSVQFTNTGNAVVTFSSISARAPFTVVNNCPLNLAPGASCIVEVLFSSTSRGTFNGTLTVVSNAPGGSRTIPLTVIAQVQAVPIIHVTPTLIGFGGRMIGTQSASQRITIINDGGAAATLSSLATSVDFLITSTTCGVSLAPSETCFADVAFRPLGFGPRPGQFTFNSNASGSPHVVEMSGTGCRPFSVSNRAGAASACAP